MYIVKLIDPSIFDSFLVCLYLEKSDIVDY